MSEGLKQSYFRKNLRGLQIINAYKITAQIINIPNGLLSTSSVTCNTMNVRYIEYPGGICTNVSANNALINQNVSIVPFVNSSITSYNVSVVNALSLYNTSIVNYTNVSIIGQCNLYNTAHITYVNIILLYLIIL